jgi:hypothetical protein
MPRFGLTEPIQRFSTSGAIAANRLVTLAPGGTLALAGAADDNVIGASTCGVDRAVDASSGPPVHLKSTPGFALVEASAAITRGAIVYQAASGKIADAGSVRAGVAITGGSTGELIELLFC